MKFKLYILLIVMLLPLLLNAQEYFKLTDINNSDYPFIKVSIKTNKVIDLKELQIFEDNKQINFKTDTVLLKDYKKDRSILFVVKENLDDEIKSSLIDIIKTFSGGDKINIAAMQESDTTEIIIYYLSPEFSNNHMFFVNFLEENVFKNIHYKISRRLKKQTKLIENNIFSKQDAFSNKGIIFIADKLKIKPECCSNILKPKAIPVYILLTKKPSEFDQVELSTFCKNSGGMYTVTDKLAVKDQLFLYLDDIAWQKTEATPELYTLIFETKQFKDRNLFKIKYKESLNEYVFSKPPKYGYNNRELFLIALSALFFSLLMFFVLKNRKKRNLISLFKDIKEGIGTKKTFTKPIEINVKAKGFNKTYFLEKHIISIGRSSTNDIIIPDRTVSGSHTVISREDDSYFIQDLNSTNGTIVNGKKIKKHKLNSKDKIKLGSAMLIVAV